MEGGSVIKLYKYISKPNHRPNQTKPINTNQNPNQTPQTQQQSDDILTRRNCLSDLIVCIVYCGFIFVALCLFIVRTKRITQTFSTLGTGRGDLGASGYNGLRVSRMRSLSQERYCGERTKRSTCLSTKVALIHIHVVVCPGRNRFSRGS